MARTQRTHTVVTGKRVAKVAAAATAMVVASGTAAYASEQIALEQALNAYEESTTNYDAVRADAAEAVKVAADAQAHCEELAKTDYAASCEALGEVVADADKYGKAEAAAETPNEILEQAAELDADTAELTAVTNKISDATDTVNANWVSYSEAQREAAKKAAQAKLEEAKALVANTDGKVADNATRDALNNKVAELQKVVEAVDAAEGVDAIREQTAAVNAKSNEVAQAQTAVNDSAAKYKAQQAAKAAAAKATTTQAAATNTGYKAQGTAQRTTQAAASTYTAPKAAAAAPAAANNNVFYVQVNCTGTQAQIDTCVGATNYAPVANYLGVPYYAQHSGKGGSAWLNLQVGSKVVAQGRTYVVTGWRTVYSGGDVAQIAGMGGDAYLQTCINSSQSRVIALKAI